MHVRCCVGACLFLDLGEQAELGGWSMPLREWGALMVRQEDPEEVVVLVEVAEGYLAGDHSSAIVEVDGLVVAACIGRFQEAVAEAR
jgi:hypothetical protein